MTSAYDEQDIVNARPLSHIIGIKVSVTYHIFKRFGFASFTPFDKNIVFSDNEALYDVTGSNDVLAGVGRKHRGYVGDLYVDQRCYVSQSLRANAPLIPIACQVYRIHTIQMTKVI